MMNRLIFIYLFLLTGYLACGQENCRDIIFAVGDSVIHDCCIRDVVDGNQVIYVKDGDTARIVARAMNKSGVYVDLGQALNQTAVRTLPANPGNTLYRDHDYKYYQSLNLDARRRQAFGVFFTLLGVGLEVAGIVIIEQQGATTLQMQKGSGFIVAGVLMETIGLPLWISGGIRKANNRKAMEEIERMNGLTIGVGQYGIGLVYKL